MALGHHGRLLVVNVSAGRQNLVESISEWLVNVVVETALIVEAGWLPELAHISTAAVVVI